jgi:hypothetical protein
MFMAVWSGVLREVDIEGSVSAFRSAHYRSVSSFGVLSLDAFVPGTDNLRRIYTIASDREHF